MTINLLSKIPLFADLPMKELDGILAAMDVKELADGEMLFREGDPGEHFYVVTKGILEVLKGAGQHEELLLNIMQRRGALWRNEPHHARRTSHSQCARTWRIHIALDEPHPIFGPHQETS